MWTTTRIIASSHSGRSPIRATIDLIDAALGAGAKRVIPKDVDNTELIEVVKELLTTD